MYFKYLWNNFLHTQVEICTAMILAMPSTQSESPEINRENDQEPIRENILIKHVGFSSFPPARSLKHTVCFTHQSLMYSSPL